MRMARRFVRIKHGGKAGIAAFQQCAPFFPCPHGEYLAKTLLELGLGITIIAVVKTAIAGQPQLFAKQRIELGLE